MTVRPKLPNHGVVLRSGTNVSTIAIGTPILQIACPRGKATMPAALMPSTGICAASPKSRPSKDGGLNIEWSIRPGSSTP